MYRIIDGWVPLKDIAIESNRPVASVYSIIKQMKLKQGRTLAKIEQTKTNGTKYATIRSVGAMKVEDVPAILERLSKAKRYPNRKRRWAVRPKSEPVDRDHSKLSTRKNKQGTANMEFINAIRKLQSLAEKRNVTWIKLDVVARKTQYNKQKHITVDEDVEIDTFSQ
jgi:hypothetical protein